MNQVKTIATIIMFSLFISGPVYAKKDKEKKLPPGLQKKVQSGKSLPPGWQKKLVVGEILDDEVYEQGKVVVTDPNQGLVTISIDGKLIRVIENTREIVKILDSF